MKKLSFFLSVMVLCTMFSFNNASASSSEPVTTIELNATDAARAQVLTDRLTELKEMDKSDMTRAEKKELREEVKSINEELQQVGGGVYLSVGAIIVVLLLLILLL